MRFEKKFVVEKNFRNIIKVFLKEKQFLLNILQELLIVFIMIVILLEDFLNQKMEYLKGLSVG